ncbi:hypothetical protein PGT21_033874 [Puccinia graminis f. sp. tritici]|uniref:Uncharacterized protein n=1 Tax=Puccinia graminis f. sp. tritici TaxID=56615 RepID=A0A5B0M7S0_PUCGR|nr:hypothetical protein PGT21_033874 [Puccinia graminis f. sp. tritici]KAA1120349.1 hypothetical protein PGTUg99_016871 [Puccinia graminis f. sp. tritici]
MYNLSCPSDYRVGEEEDGRAGSMDNHQHSILVSEVEVHSPLEMTVYDCRECRSELTRSQLSEEAILALKLVRPSSQASHIRDLALIWGTQDTTAISAIMRGSDQTPCHEARMIVEHVDHDEICRSSSTGEE